MPVSPVSSGAAGTSLTARAQAWAEGLDFKGAAARRLQIARTKASASGPPAVQRAFALYRTWEAADLGSARLLKATVDGKDLWALHTTTDGDDCFLELFSGRGALLGSGVIDADGAIAWDAAPGQVRDRVARPDASPSTTAFADDVDAANAAGSAGGDAVIVDELRQAARRLLGVELTTASIDSEENAALMRALADGRGLTAAARAHALRLGALYLSDAPKALKSPRHKTLAQIAGTTSAFAQSATLSKSEVRGRKDAPRIQAFTALLLDHAPHTLPTQVEPITKTAATKVLRDAGATAAETRAAIDALGAGGASLFSGKVFTHDASSSASVPRLQGIALFSSTGDGKKVAALVVPQVQAPPRPGQDPRAAIATLTGVDRAIDIVTDLGNGRSRLDYRPSWGGVLSATLDLSNPAAPAITDSAIAPVLEPPLKDLLAQHVQNALGRPVDVIGWVGRDNRQGPGFVVAHKAPGTLWPIHLSTVRIALGGAATVTDKRIGTSADDQALAQDLALNIARAQAQQMVNDPAIGPDARLEVALRTGWVSGGDLERQDSASSPVGFDPATERVQWMLPRVWADNAIVVTFANDGTARVDAVN